MRAATKKKRRGGGTVEKEEFKLPAEKVWRFRGLSELVCRGGPGQTPDHQNHIFGLKFARAASPLLATAPEVKSRFLGLSAFLEVVIADLKSERIISG
jgi:hypothetical protein